MAEDVHSPRVTRFGIFEVDLQSGELRKAGLKLKLTGQPFQVLAVLLERPGEVVTREELQKRLWPDTFVDIDHNLNTAINKIREALDDSAESPRFVETLPRRGYRFIAPVDGVSATLPAGTSGSSMPHPHAARHCASRFCSGRAYCWPSWVSFSTRGGRFLDPQCNERSRGSRSTMVYRREQRGHLTAASSHTVLTVAGNSTFGCSRSAAVILSKLRMGKVQTGSQTGHPTGSTLCIVPRMEMAACSSCPLLAE